MGSESSDVVRFDLGPLLQGQMRVAKLKSAFNCLLLKNAVYLLNYVGLFRWIHLASGHRCILGLVIITFLLKFCIIS